MAQRAERAALITGGAQGIGFATARTLLEQRTSVAICDLNEPLVEQAADELRRSTGSPCDAVVADATLSSDAQRLIDHCLASFGRLDTLVNNVGGRGVPPGLEATAEEAELDLDLCLTSTFVCSRAAVPAIAASGGGAIVNVSSSAGRYYSDMAGVPYCAGKAGVMALTRALAAELGAQRIRCNAVVPGNTLTEQGQRDWDSLPAETRKRIEASIPLGRLAGPQDIADTIAFLASDQARYITGVSIDVNGGQHMS
jgi:NAD(P)-dependent dehydrogenase (short-subunit alcohol dehydrogenase family)